MNNWAKYIAELKKGKEEGEYYEEEYRGTKLLQIDFFEFWKKAYEKKNNFFCHVYAEAERHVKNGICGKEWLEEDRCKELWHRHCDFCRKTIDTNLHEECFCTEDIELWICADCFNAFKEHFGWTVEKVWDISKEYIENTVGIIIEHRKTGLSTEKSKKHKNQTDKET